MIAWAVLLSVFCHLPANVISQTLSLQGNLVFNSIKSTKQASSTLKDCARICMERPLCRMFVYNTNNRNCETASVLSKTPTRRLNQYELAYLRGMQCTLDRHMMIRTRKMGKLFHNSKGHRYLPSSRNQEYLSMHRQDPLYCSSMDDVLGCDLVSFGSADGGVSLTKDSTLLNYVNFGYCAKRKGSCNANYPVSGYIQRRGKWAGDFLYDRCPECDKTSIKTSFICHFWKGKQCEKGRTSVPFPYEFQMK